MNVKSLFILTICCLSVACSDSKNAPDAVVSSEGLSSADINITLVATLSSKAEAEEVTSSATVEANVYTNKQYDFAQYVELTDEDNITINLEGNTYRLTPELLPDHNTPIFVEYKTEIEPIDTASPIQVTFNRNGELAFDENLTLLDETPLVVDFNSETLTLTSELTATWVGEPEYQYGLTLVFSCKLPDNRSTSIKRRFPNSALPSLTSPFVFDMSTLPSPPSNQELTNCQMALTLTSELVHSPDQSFTTGTLSLFSIRNQTEVIPIYMTSLSE